MFKKLKDVILLQLTMGATPEKLTQSVVGGILIGVFPVLGSTTALSGLAAYLFKLNHVAIQTANYLIYPLQLLMIPVYIKTVSFVFEVGDVPIRPDLILTKFQAGPLNFTQQYGMIAVYAIVLWAIVSLILYLVLYPVILKVIKKFKKGSV